MNCMLKLSILLLTLVLLSLAKYSYSEKAESAPCDLPDTAALVLKQKYPGWRLLNSNDLAPEDRDVWNRTHPHACPGIAIGQYEGKSKVQYAVLMIPVKKSSRLKTKLVMLRLTPEGKIVPHVLYEDKARLISYPVIYKGGPGQYTDFYDPDNKIAVATDAVIYDRIGASASAFYFANDKYHEVLISD